MNCTAGIVVAAIVAGICGFVVGQNTTCVNLFGVRTQCFTTIGVNK